ncbi:hypothetical protein BGW38_009034, partial [Lunasporangiospora selenospora]
NDNMSLDNNEPETFTRERREWIPSESFLEDYAPTPLHDVEWILTRDEKAAIWDNAPKRRGTNFDSPDIPPVLYQKLSKKS